MTSTHNRPYGPRRKRTQASETGPDLRGLDALHRRLVTAVCAGDWAAFEKDEVLDADILTALITGRSYQGREPWPISHNGVAVFGGRVNTRLDLSHAQIDWPLSLIEMNLPEGMDLTQSQLIQTRFDHCQIKYVDLSGAVVKGQLTANHTTFNNRGEGALLAQAADITGGLFLNNATLNGQCDINSAKIGYQVCANEAVFHTPDGIALWAQGAEIADSLFLDNAILNGQCAINGAKIQGCIIANKAKFHAQNGTALMCQDVEITGFVFLKDAIITGNCDFNSATTAEIFLRNATLNGCFMACFGSQIKQLDLSDAALTSTRYVRLDAQASDYTASKSEPEHAVALDLEDARIRRLDMPQSPQHKIKGIVNLTRCHVGHFCDHKDAWPAPLMTNNKQWITPQYRLDPETGDDIGYYELNGFTYDYLASPDGRSGESGEDRTAEARKRWLLSQKAEQVADQFNPQPWRHMAARLEAQGHDDAARSLAIYRRRYQRHSNAVTGRGRIFVSLMLDLLSRYGFNPWRTLGISAGVIMAFALIYGVFAQVSPMPDDGYSLLAGYTPSGPVSDYKADPPPVFIRAQADDVTAATNFDKLGDADTFLSNVYPDFNPLWYSLDVFVPVLDLGMDTYWRPNPNYVVRDNWCIALNLALLTQRLTPVLSCKAKNPALASVWQWHIGSALYWLTIFQRFVGAILIAVMVTSFTGLLTREDKRG